jgi:hypothetical protein
MAAEFESPEAERQYLTHAALKRVQLRGAKNTNTDEDLMLINYLRGLTGQEQFTDPSQITRHMTTDAIRTTGGLFHDRRAQRAAIEEMLGSRSNTPASPAVAVDAPVGPTALPKPRGAGEKIVQEKKRRLG